MTDEYKGTTVKELKTKDVSLSSTATVNSHKGKSGMAVFYFDWCGFCVRLKPELIKLSKKVPVYAIRIDDPKANAIANLYGITSAPHLRFVDSNGVIKQQPYYGDRTVAALTKYIKEKTTTGGCKTTGGAKKVAKKVIKKKVAKKVIKKKVAKKVVKKVLKK